jgi:PPM family protein phosphatase
MRLQAFGITDRGMVRAENQDSISVKVLPGEGEGNSLFAAVADGVGGGKAGHTASSAAVETILEKYLAAQESGRACIKAAFEAANQRIMEMSAENQAYEWMATTCTGIVIEKDQAAVCHVGDSRLYRIRNGEIYQMTEDHTVARRLYREGTIGSGDIENHPYNHVLTDALGVRHKPRIDVVQCTVKEKDIFLLCSDGLTKYLTAEELRDSAASQSAEESAESLVALAKERGGDDNISVVIVKVESEKVGGATAKITTDSIPVPSSAKKGRFPVTAGIAALVALLVIGFFVFFRYCPR